MRDPMIDQLVPEYEPSEEFVTQTREHLRHAWRETSGTRPRRDRRQLVLAAAAGGLVAATVAALVVVAPMRSRDDSTVPGSVEAPASTERLVPATSTVPAPATSAVPAPPATTPPDELRQLGTVLVGDVWQMVDESGEELYTARIGSAPDELGATDCSECDPLVPWAPVQTPDGRLVIADNVNDRWVIVTDGVPATVPYSHPYPIAPPIVDSNGRIYALITYPNGQEPTSSTSEVQVFDPDDMSVAIETYPAPYSAAWSNLSFGRAGLLANRRVVEGTKDVVGDVADAPAIYWDTLDGGPLAVEVTWMDTVRRWEFPDGWAIGGMGPAAALADGSVLVMAWNVVDTSQPGASRWVLLRPDGTASAVTAGGTGLNGSKTVTRDSVLTLELTPGEQFTVVRYGLPPGAEDIREGLLKALGTVGLPATYDQPDPFGGHMSIELPDGYLTVTATEDWRHAHDYEAVTVGDIAGVAVETIRYESGIERQSFVCDGVRYATDGPIPPGFDSFEAFVGALIGALGCTDPIDPP